MKSRPPPDYDYTWLRLGTPVRDLVAKLKVANGKILERAEIAAPMDKNAAATQTPNMAAASAPGGGARGLTTRAAADDATATGGEGGAVGWGISQTAPGKTAAGSCAELPMGNRIARAAQSPCQGRLSVGAGRLRPIARRPAPFAIHASSPEASIIWSGVGPCQRMGQPCSSATSST